MSPVRAEEVEHELPDGNGGRRSYGHGIGGYGLQNERGREGFREGAHREGSRRPGEVTERRGGDKSTASFDGWR